MQYIFFVYILKCADNSYYTGVTNNLERRLSEHNLNLIRHCYTSTRLPVELKYVATFNDIRLAIGFEKQVKRWSRNKKEALINGNDDELHNLSKCNNHTHYSKKQ